MEEDGLPSESLISTLERINREIDDRNYELGISFFMNEGKNLRTMLPDIWTSEIEPYLEEYFYDQPDKVEAFRWLDLSARCVEGLGRTRPTMRIEIREEQDEFFSESALDVATAWALHHDRRFEFAWPNPGNDFRYRIRSHGFVGIVPADESVIVIEPKAPVSSIFGMLEVAYDLQSVRVA